MLLLGTKNTTTQTVPAGSTIALGSAYRRYCKKNSWRIGFERRWSHWNNYSKCKEIIQNMNGPLMKNNKYMNDLFCFKRTVRIILPFNFY